MEIKITEEETNQLLESVEGEGAPVSLAFSPYGVWLMYEGEEDRLYKELMSIRDKARKGLSVIEMAEKWLNESGFDGLFNPDLECACHKGDLEPCGEIHGNCQAGYDSPDPTGEYDFLVVATKEEVEQNKKRAAENDD